MMAPLLKRSQSEIEEIENIDLTGEDYPELNPQPRNKKQRHLEQTPIPIDDSDDETDGEDAEEEDDDDDESGFSMEDEVTEMLRRAAISDYVLPEGCRRIQQATAETGGTVTPGTTKELYDGDFLGVNELFRDRNGKVWMAGDLLRREKFVNHYLKRGINEVCVIIIAPADHERRKVSLGKYQTIRPLTAALSTRNVTFTNQNFPAQRDLSITVGYHDGIPIPQLEENCALVCRWKYIIFCDNVTRRPTSWRLMHLDFDESDPGKRSTQVRIWREFQGDGKTADVMKGAPHTAGDAFSCTGGSAKAAEKAGFRLQFTVEIGEDQCKSLKKNFPSCKVFKMDVSDFSKLPISTRSRMRVTALHVSPPCQFFSPLHTRAGKDDDKNSAAIFVIADLLQTYKPRILTLEQTAGLLRGSKHREYFHRLIHQIAGMSGYNVTWKIINFAETGCVQARPRLWMYASCPGEPLPAYPEPTHGNEPHLKPFTTIYDVLNILRGKQDRIPEHMKQFTPRDTMPYNPRQPLRQLISTDGGKGDFHPDGGRSFTLQELALLAGFLLGHYFHGNLTNIRKDIGNAVPTIAAIPYFATVLASLKKFDEEIRAEMTEVIELD